MGVGPFRVLNDFNLDVTAGNVPGYTQQTIVGLSLSVPVVPADIWGGTGLYAGQPNSNVSQQIRITSTAITDALNSTGAHAYAIRGLLTPESTEFTSEIVLAHPTDGTLGVTTVNSYYRVRRVLVVAAGSSETANGVITAQHDITVANIFAEIPLTFDVSQLATMTVPANCEMTFGKTLYTLRRVGGNLSGNAAVSVNVRAPGSIFQSFSTVNVTNDSTVNADAENMGPVPAGSDIKFSIREVSNADVSISIRSNLTFRRVS